jgi:hypothetical protein
MTENVSDDSMKPLAEVLPTDAELRLRECLALRELDLVRRLRRAVQRADEFREADGQQKQRRGKSAALAG